ncbi:hypothetical protein [Streptacidiphilus melanogenes]|uniref:hypothetical protein n=1 Tax=Streptacidiphilus melanogenes TaxID=411235 RepID=UPI000694D5CB|nr:hypothetical protein [Streptacidiphilus melanogenes]
MGFTGDFVLARSDVPLRERALFASGCTDGHLDCVSSCRSRPGGWQTLQIHHGVRDDSLAAFQELVHDTAAPILIANVMDSDVCQVRGLTPSGARWSTFLDPPVAADYGIPEPAPGAAADITRWAAEAGFTADAEALAAVLTKRADPFVETLLFELIDACGFPTGLPDGVPVRPSAVGAEFLGEP